MQYVLLLPSLMAGLLIMASTLQHWPLLKHVLLLVCCLCSLLRSTSIGKEIWCNAIDLGGYRCTASSQWPDSGLGEAPKGLVWRWPFFHYDNFFVLLSCTFVGNEIGRIVIGMWADSIPSAHNFQMLAWRHAETHVPQTWLQHFFFLNIYFAFLASL